MSRELTRPLARTWWLRKAPYFRFMIRELTSLAVLAYALFVIVVLFSSGETGSFSALHGFLQSPLSVWAHVVILVFALYHTGTWIALTPKVMVVWREDEQIEPDLVAGMTSVVFLLLTGSLLWLVLA